MIGQEIEVTLYLLECLVIVVVCRILLCLLRLDMIMKGLVFVLSVMITCLMLVFCEIMFNRKLRPI